jgi:hypothetical protein
MEEPGRKGIGHRAHRGRPRIKGEAGFQEVEWPGGISPPALTEMDVTVSRHPALII